MPIAIANVRIVKKENNTVVLKGLIGVMTKSINPQFNTGCTVRLRADRKTFEIMQGAILAETFLFSQIEKTEIEPAEAIAKPATAELLLELLQTDFFLPS